MPRLRYAIFPLIFLYALPVMGQDRQYTALFFRGNLFENTPVKIYINDKEVFFAHLDATDLARARLDVYIVISLANNCYQTTVNSHKTQVYHRLIPSLCADKTSNKITLKIAIRKKVWAKEINLNGCNYWYIRYHHDEKTKEKTISFLDYDPSLD